MSSVQLTTTPESGPDRRLLLAAAAFLLVMASSLYQAVRDLPATQAIAEQQAVTASAPAATAPLYVRDFVPDTPARYVHSASAVDLGDGRLLAFWYAGEEEGTRDTKIYGARFDPQRREWGPLEVLLTRPQLAAGLGRKVKKLGNPVMTMLPDGRLALLVVSTAAFGWAASNINVLVSSDEGRSWDSFRQLQLSPWFNLSTLVRGVPRRYENGDLLVPVYHEFMGKFGEILRLDEHQEVVSKKRLTWGRDTLQPTVAAPLDEDGAVAFLRSARRDVHRVTMIHRDPQTGAWGEPVVTQLPNPNTGLDALRLPDGGILLAFNDHPVDRTHLTLARSDDNGASWQRLQVVEEGAPKSRDVSYPALVHGSDGTYHLFYSWRTSEIRHVMFNQAWLDAQR